MLLLVNRQHQRRAVWVNQVDADSDKRKKNNFESAMFERFSARRPNQSILKEISPECSLEGLMLKLKLQYFSHLMWRADSLEKPWCWERLRVGGQREDRGWDGWMASLTWWTRVWANSGSWWWIGNPACWNPWACKESNTTEWLNWTEVTSYTWDTWLHRKTNCNTSSVPTP